MQAWILFPLRMAFCLTIFYVVAIGVSRANEKTNITTVASATIASEIPANISQNTIVRPDKRWSQFSIFVSVSVTVLLAWLAIELLYYKRFHDAYNQLKARGATLVFDNDLKQLPMQYYFSKSVTVDLAGKDIVEKDFDWLMHIPKLKMLNLAEADLCQGFEKQLLQLHDLRTVDLSGNDVTVEQLQPLLPRLTVLR